MTVHHNSVETYHDLTDYLSGRRGEIYEHIKNNGILTDRQVKDGLNYDDMNQVRPRITELVDAGILHEVDSVIDEKTGRTVRAVSIKPVCGHEIYKQGRHMTATKALRMISNKKSNIVWMGQAITNCEICGEDLTKYPAIVEVKTKDEYLKGLSYG